MNNNNNNKEKKTQPISSDVAQHIWQWEGLANTCPASSFPEASTCPYNLTKEEFLGLL